MNTNEKNKLIAEFMGGTPQPHGRLTIIKWGEWQPFPMMFQLEHLIFHSCYDWIMSVVEKIQCQFGEDAEFMVRINKGYERGVLKYSAYIKIKSDPEKSETENEYFIASSNSHIESIYLVVIKFIEWYNQDKTK